MELVRFKIYSVGKLVYVNNGIAITLVSLLGVRNIK